MHSASRALGGAFANLSLLELATAGDVTVELPFTFALNTFDPSAYQNIQTIFERHSEGDFAGFAEQLTALRNTDVRGLLTGFIDLVWQSPNGRDSLVDYKTNLFTVNGKAIMEAYSQQHLHEKMIEKSYLLQAAVYAAAVDAWLSVVNPDWDYDRDFGGVTFTFLRAMGEHTEALPGNGVFHVAVPQSLAREIAEAFGIGSRTADGLHLGATV